MQTVALRTLSFDDFKKDEYRAFKLEGHPDCISLPTILDRLRDALMELERQMEAGDHLTIALTVARPHEAALVIDGSDVTAYIQNAINQAARGFGWSSHSTP